MKIFLSRCKENLNIQNNNHMQVLERENHEILMRKNIHRERERERNGTSQWMRY